MPEEKVDWFGKPMPARPAREQPTREKQNANPCVDTYGPGPQGKECKDCIHIVGICHARVYYKCRLRKLTNGHGSDHKLRYAACARFELREDGKAIPLYDGR